MLNNYLPVLLHVLVAVGFATFALLTNLLVCRTGVRSANKEAAYECGVPPTAEPQPRFSVKFYLVAMLFILFDIEVVFMYPWAVVFSDLIANNVAHNMPFDILWSMFTFVVLLLFGYLYAVKKGALDWKS